MRAISRKTLLIAATVLVLCVLAAGYLILPIIHRHHDEANRKFQITWILRAYIWDTHGKFPASIADLEKRHYIAWDSGKGCFRIPAEQTVRVGEGVAMLTSYDVPPKDIERIRFGVDLSQCEIKDGILKNKFTAQRIILWEYEWGGQVEQGNISEQLFGDSIDARKSNSVPDKNPTSTSKPSI